MNDVNVNEMGLLEFHEYCKKVNVSEMDMHEFAMFCKRWNERKWSFLTTVHEMFMILRYFFLVFPKNPFYNDK